MPKIFLLTTAEKPEVVEPTMLERRLKDPSPALCLFEDLDGLREGVAGGSVAGGSITAPGPVLDILREW